MGKSDGKFVGRKQLPRVRPGKVMDADPEWASDAAGVIKTFNVIANAAT